MPVISGDLVKFLSKGVQQFAKHPTPKMKVSEAQMKEVLRRVLKKEGGKLKKETAEAVMNQYEPPGMEQTGLLFKKQMTPAGMQGYSQERYPIDQARQIYEQNPNQYVPSTYGGPPVNELSMQPGLAESIAYQRVKDVPVVKPPSQQYAENFAKREAEQREIANRLRAGGTDPDMLRADADLKGVLASKTGEIPYVQNEPSVLSEADKLMGVAQKAEELWKFAGGPRSMVAKAFDLYKNHGRGSSKMKGGSAKMLKTTKDYWTSCFIRFTEEPGKFAKMYPREFKIMSQIADEFESAKSGAVPSGVE